MSIATDRSGSAPTTAASICIVLCPDSFSRLCGKENFISRWRAPWLVDANGNLWLGTEGTGLFFTERGKGETRQFKHVRDTPASLSHNNVKCLLPEGNNGLWVGTLKGLNYYDFKTDRFETFHHQPGHSNSLPDDAVYDLAKDSDGALWIGTYRGGLCKFDPHKNTFETLTHDPENSSTLSSNGVTQVFFDSRGNLWVGTISGLKCQAPRQRSFHRYVHNPADATTLSDNYILCIYEDRQNRIWVGTRSNGLNLLLPGQHGFIRFGTQHGLPGNAIFGIQEDQNGYLWISTDNGLSKLDPVDLSYSTLIVVMDWFANSSISTRIAKTARAICISEDITVWWYSAPNVFWKTAPCPT